MRCSRRAKNRREAPCAKPGTESPDWCWRAVWCFIHPIERRQSLSAVSRRWQYGVFGDPSLWRFVLVSNSPVTVDLIREAARTDVHRGAELFSGTRAALSYLGEGALPLRFSELARIPDLRYVETLVVEEPADPEYNLLTRTLSWRDPRVMQHRDFLWLSSRMLFLVQFSCLRALRLPVSMVEYEGPLAQSRRQIVFEWLRSMPKTLQYLKLDSGSFFLERFYGWLPCRVPEWLPNLRGLDHFSQRCINQEAVHLWPLSTREQIDVLDGNEQSSSVPVLLRWFGLFPRLKRLRWYGLNVPANDLTRLCTQLPRTVSVMHLWFEHTTPYVYPTLEEWSCFGVLRQQLRELFISFDSPSPRCFTEGTSPQTLSAHLAAILPETVVLATDLSYPFHVEEGGRVVGYPDPMDHVFLPRLLEPWHMHPDCSGRLVKVKMNCVSFPG
ncbi:unnamed protein product [Prorocentrum cordatum]|uniref:F-box domain-containing protein n=1 Tax=Prorocentrum cordatum TaxID=2364126 RepID=A0ABN9PUV8_9DINO|nr:unnamed protein product [Polarella glacialis]